MLRPADEHLDRMRDRLRSGAGDVDVDVRRAALDGHDVPPAVAVLVEKIRRHAYKVTDEDVAAAKDAGWSDSQLFELIVATAVGCGLRARDRCDELLSRPAT